MRPWINLASQTEHTNEQKIQSLDDQTLKMSSRQETIVTMTKFLRKRYEITSSSNEKFKWLKDLWTGRAIRENKACLVFGSKIVREIVEQNKLQILFECIRANDLSLVDNADVLQFSNELFREIDELGTGTSFLVVRPPEMSEWNPGTPPLGLDMICPYSDPHNLGATVRSALAFGASRVILTKEAANPFLPRAVRASSGAVFQMKFLNGPSLADTCTSLQTLPVGTAAVLDMKGTPIHQFPWKDKMYLVAGEEGQGVPSTKLPHASIPMQGTESLNAAVAASLAMYTFRMKHPLKVEAPSTAAKKAEK